MTGSPSAYSVGFVFCIAAFLNAWRQHRRRGGFPLPPGPTGLPLVGNLLNIDSSHPWLSYEEWGKRHGGLVYANILGKDFIIINSVEVARDLLERRSAVYSDRPYIPANELFGMDFNSGLLPYGNQWRLHRKLFNTALNKKAISRYKPISLSKARQLVENLFDEPEDFAKHCKTFATATIMAAIYGYEVARKNDPFVTKVEHLVGLFKEALTPERAALLIVFPFLAHIPSWMPGGEYKQKAAECHALAEDVLTSPVEYVMKNMAAGTAGQSVVHDLLGTQNVEEYEDTIKAVAASAFLGGAETNDASLQVFILAMVLHPEIQAKAREEIDRVVGTHRLPDFGDRPDLPYVEAVYRETLRWRPVVPSALPHMTVKSDIYQGMYIPKGAIVLTNIWAMAHDETRFDNPMAFIPERHLTSTGTLAEETAPRPTFGFGRRSCPGKHFADQSVWGAIVTMLATLRIAKACDEFGNEIDIKAEFTGGLSSAPKPFVCSITPCSSSAEDFIRTRHDHAY
ncbi:cytochrome P450 [Boletus edulis BED1]|uniref:Cytochrome P450 n=1 Tax=Boletus edulis BED1 TaxID=1328754 RepID=A0AAD4BX18_BOLED|nr:cytochrome P450 [Boletus edulis BED1]